MAPPGTIIGQLAPTVPGSPSALNAASQQMLTQSLANQVRSLKINILLKYNIIKRKYIFDCSNIVYILK